MGGCNLLKVWTMKRAVRLLCARRDGMRASRLLRRSGAFRDRLQPRQFGWVEAVCCFTDHRGEVRVIVIIGDIDGLVLTICWSIVSRSRCWQALRRMAAV